MCLFGSTMVVLAVLFLWLPCYVLSILAQNFFLHKQRVHVSFRDNAIVNQRIEAGVRREVAFNCRGFDRFEHKTDYHAALGAHAKLPSIAGKPGRFCDPPLRCYLLAGGLFDQENCVSESARVLHFLDQHGPAFGECVVGGAEGEWAVLVEKQVRYANIISAGPAHEIIFNQRFLLFVAFLRQRCRHEMQNE
uniref:Putative secreted protein n=1 Tax=Anopheles darlingi TaxID=43151 RepID=A0A2M4DFD5_ANODA